MGRVLPRGGEESLTVFAVGTDDWGWWVRSAGQPGAGPTYCITAPLP